MKKIWLLFWLSVGLCFSGPSFAQAPHSIAGFTLNENIERYQDLIKGDTVLPVRHMEYLSEVEVKHVEGFKSGYIRFGNCAAQGRIVRIKMKYDCSDKAFYEELLERFKKKFGKPDEWRGDPFHVYIAWKWSFKDKDNNKISLILQHYSVGDDEETPGNSIKLTMTNLVHEERECYAKKHPEAFEEEEGKCPETEKQYEQLLPN